MTDGADVASPLLSDGTAVYTPGISERTGSTTTYYHMDAPGTGPYGQGSVVATTNGSQTQTGDMRYDAFGTKTWYVNSVGTFGWNAKSQYRTDTESGLMLLGHRYYDSATGRFISQDPDEDGWNWYAYCGNNPVGGVDVTGQSPLLVGIAIGGAVAIGAAIAYAYPDRGTHALTDQQRARVEELITALRVAAAKADDRTVTAYLARMRVSGQFNKGQPKDAPNDTSETRAGGLLRGGRPRVILSADFFERDRTSQFTTLLHEAYHVGSRDFTENRVDDWTSSAAARLGVAP